MLSTTPLFYFCTVLIFILFYSVRSPSLQTLVLAAGSFAMYATEGLPFLLLLLTISSLLTSACSFIAANSKTKRAKIAMISGVIINLAVLAIFKYKELLVPMHIQPDITWVQKFLLFGAADWNFLLHIPRHQLGRGRMAQSRRASTQEQRPASLPRHRSLSVVLSAARGWPDNKR